MVEDRRGEREEMVVVEGRKRKEGKVVSSSSLFSFSFSCSFSIDNTQHVGARIHSHYSSLKENKGEGKESVPSLHRARSPP